MNQETGSAFGEPAAVRMAQIASNSATSAAVARAASCGWSPAVALKNAGPGGTPPRESSWGDYLYLSADPFLDLLTEYGSPWGMEERTPG